jgi:hypothetical protein
LRLRQPLRKRLSGMGMPMLVCNVPVSLTAQLQPGTVKEEPPT